MRRAWLFALLLACDDDKGDSVPVDDSDLPAHTGETDGTPDTPGPDPDDTDDTAAETGSPCVEDAAGELPPEAEWIVLDGASSSLYSFHRTTFNEYTGYYGTYDLNDEDLTGANGFKLPRPATVVGVSARWDDLSSDVPVAATVVLWPDFGSDGYVFDVENPIATATRCLTSADEELWVDYALPEPFRVDQPLHVYAGYARDTDLDTPDLLFEDTYNDAEPFTSGVRFEDVDKRTFYLGAAFPWYTWQIRLAVIYDESIADEDKLFTLSGLLSVSSRVAWGDYDGDGDDDVMSVGPTLYQNNGDGTFTDVSSTALPGGTNGSGGGVWGDLDNDGCLDYFGQGGGNTAGEVLLRNNCDGTFSDVLATSGIDDLQTERDCNGDGLEEHSPTEGAAWFDLDNDGFLDLYLANYECSSESAPAADYYANYDDKLWRNNGDGTFSDWSVEAGLDLSNLAGRGVTTLDGDQDGWTDVFVSNYRLNRNLYYQNNGDGTVSNLGESNGTEGTHSRYDTWGHTIGTAVGDIDNDGDFDLVAANLAHPFYYHFSDRTNVLINDGSGGFTNEGDARGIYYRETHSNPTLFDADNDGDLDLFITAVYPERDSDFYLNDGAGNFTLANYENGLVVQNGWGAAAADYDQDGDVDMLAYALYDNHASEEGAHWIQVVAVGGMRGADTSLGLSNRAAIGAVVEARAGALSQLRHVSGGSGTSNQDSLVQHFGLGEAELIDELIVRFPGGATVTVEDVAADQRIWVCEDGRSAAGYHPCE